MARRIDYDWDDWESRALQPQKYTGDEFSLDDDLDFPELEDTSYGDQRTIAYGGNEPISELRGRIWDEPSDNQYDDALHYRAPMRIDRTRIPQIRKVATAVGWTAVLIVGSNGIFDMAKLGHGDESFISVSQGVHAFDGPVEGLEYLYNKVASPIGWIISKLH